MSKSVPHSGWYNRCYRVNIPVIFRCMRRIMLEPGTDLRWSNWCNRTPNLQRFVGCPSRISVQPVILLFNCQNSRAVDGGGSSLNQPLESTVYAQVNGFRRILRLLSI
uniref:Uncharacterized protein n=1 Tax=Anopheles minimus TaxID=112268 RepID=A0A182WBB3_9DIPT